MFIIALWQRKNRPFKLFPSSILHHGCLQSTHLATAPQTFLLLFNYNSEPRNEHFPSVMVHFVNLTPSTIT